MSSTEPSQVRRLLATFLATEVLPSVLGATPSHARFLRAPVHLASPSPSVTTTQTFRGCQMPTALFLTPFAPFVLLAKSIRRHRYLATSELAFAFFSLDRARACHLHRRRFVSCNLSTTFGLHDAQRRDFKFLPLRAHHTLFGSSCTLVVYVTKEIR
ncbi:hypothetical protein PF008_g599 [Phytophthora fragariae]|uniref:Uncharacterized protein n=1 Tax=Phytophthora fragariae TaxID=53985 RepID=A0A6G0SMS8_9STRA|nr:hypothetical protein PF008_g599 [Phytophthora fragariae]